MAGVVGTREVLEQLDARLGNLEQDLRELRAEVKEEIGGLRAEMKEEIGGLRAEVNNRFLGFENRFNRLEGKMDETTRWLVGLMLVSWLTLMVSIWLKS